MLETVQGVFASTWVYNHEPFPARGCEILVFFWKLFCALQHENLEKITLYSGSLGLGVDEERS